MDLRCWALLSSIDQSILDKVKLAYVFGHFGREALLITNDDEVLAYGTNRSDCLGLKLGNVLVLDTSQSWRVVELRKKGVKGFSFGGISSDSTFVVAYTHSGSVYTWGKQIGPDNNNTTVVSSPSLIELSTKISIVACGSNHCLALSMEGEVYSWGSNEFGQLGCGVTKSGKPVKVEGLSKKIVVKISCGANFSVVALDDGQVYAFGSNKQCQLGSSNKSFSLSSVLKEVNLPNVVIEDLVCGASHVLALSNIGELYVWGKNDRGELGLGDKNMRLLPEINKKIGKVIDVAASFACSISAAMTESYKVYMWGDFSDFAMSQPVNVTVKSLQDVFAIFANPKIMYKPIVRPSQMESMSLTLQKAFKDDRGTSDLTIRAEGKEIFVHKSILKLRSEYFRVFLQDHWVDKDQEILDINRKYDVIYPYIRYLYTGELTMDPKLVLELLNLADEYQDSAFKNLCIENFHRSLTIDNVANLYSVALKSNAKNLLESCISFASKHVCEVLQTPAVLKWNASTMKEFMIMCGKKKLFKS